MEESFYGIDESRINIINLIDFYDDMNVVQR